VKLERRLKIVILTPHFEPDTAPTGAVVTKLVEGLARRGHHIEVITSLPWYRLHKIEAGYEGRLERREDTPWGSILRLHPFPAEDKTDIARRAASFLGFTALAAKKGRKGGDVDVVLAVSPPLTLGVAGHRIARARNARFVFNIQDVFPDVVIELGILKNPALIRAARRLERHIYRKADAVTVLSDDLRQNVAGRSGDPSKVRVIPNFVDTEAIQPQDPGNPDNQYRREHDLIGKTVVMYAGNVGFSQSLDLVIGAASATQEDANLVYVINGNGAARIDLERDAAGLPNVVFVDAQPADRLSELLAAADIHVVPLKRGLARSSVPSKTFSILAAGRPFVASVDPGSEIANIARDSGAGVAVPPEDAESFTKAIRRLADAEEERREMGQRARSFVETWASPAGVAERYEQLFVELCN
jgi:colanic acid biosynthesis glycosyl transferase WcaI